MRIAGQVNGVARIEGGKGRCRSGGSGGEGACSESLANLT